MCRTGVSVADKGIILSRDHTVEQASIVESENKIGEGRKHKRNKMGQTESENHLPLASGAGMLIVVWSKWRVANDSSPA